MEDTTARFETDTETKKLRKRKHLLQKRRRQLKVANENLIVNRCGI